MHDRGDHRLADAIDRAWDELFRDAPADANPAALDSDLVATVERLHALNVAPTADPVFASNLWADLMRARGIADDRRPHPALDPVPRDQAVSPLRRSTPVPNGAPSLRRGLGVPRLAAAAVLLLLVLGLVYVTVGPGRSDPGHPAGIPAAVIPTTPVPPVPTEEVLLTLPLAAGALPGGEHLIGGLNHIVMPPAGTTTWEASRGTSFPGLRVDYVLTGTYTVQVAGPAQVLRAGVGTPEAVPVDTAVTLGPGDAVAFANDTTATYANPGSTPVEVLFWILFDGSSGGYTTDPIPPGWIISDVDVQTTGLIVPTGSATLRVRRVELAAGAVVPAPPSGTLQFRVALPATFAAGTPSPFAYLLDRPSDGSIRNGNRQAISVCILTLESGGRQEGTPTL